MRAHARIRAQANGTRRPLRRTRVMVSSRATTTRPPRGNNPSLREARLRFRQLLQECESQRGSPNGSRKKVKINENETINTTNEAERDIKETIKYKQLLRGTCAVSPYRCGREETTVVRKTRVGSATGFAGRTFSHGRCHGLPLVPHGISETDLIRRICVSRGFALLCETERETTRGCCTPDILREEILNEGRARPFEASKLSKKKKKKRKK